MKIFRIISAIITSFFVGILVIFMTQDLVFKIIGAPPISTDNSESIAIYIKSIPIMALIGLLVSYITGVATAAFVCIAFAFQKKKWLSILIGSLFTILSLIYFNAYPYHPIWFMALVVITCIPSAIIAGNLAEKIIIDYDQANDEITV